MPIKDMPREKLDIILYGSSDILEFNYVSSSGNTRTTRDFYEGIINVCCQFYKGTIIL